MKTSKTIKFSFIWILLALGLATIQPVMGQASTNKYGPIFEYAVLYNGLMEFTDCSPMTINGLVQCNSNVYVGCPSSSSSSLTFNSLVTVSGFITNPAWFGYPQSTYVASNIAYNGSPAPGWISNVPPINMPVSSFTNSPNGYQAIIQLPDASDSPTNPVSEFRYFYKADLVILVTNVTPTNIATSVILKSSMFDSDPLVFSYTNNMPATSTNAAISNAVRQMNTNWAWVGVSNWLTINATFYDARQQQTNQVTQIDVGKFGTWIATNTNCLGKWNAIISESPLIFPFNGVIYVADMRTTNGMYMDCVRLTNGQTIPSIGASNIFVGGSYYTTNDAYSIPGLTVATINPLYICGLYNCSGTTNVSSTNTGGTQPCSVVCDALTILSPNWKDGDSWRMTNSGNYSSATSDTVNAAIIAGNVPSTGSSYTQYSGGVPNLPRLLEDWSSSTLWLNTSLICLYSSQQATAQYENPGIYYEAPTRKFSLDQRFNDLYSLPPGTPTYVRTSDSPAAPPATIILSNLTQVYTGGNLAPSVTTLPYGLDYSLQFEGTNSMGFYFSNAVDAGTYIVVVTVNDPFFGGVASNYFYIDPALATISMTNLTETYNGTYQFPSISTTPPGVAVTVTYNGSDDLPMNAGTYTVIAEIDDSNYYGSATNTLVISQAAAGITFSNLLQVFSGAAKSATVTTVPPGLMVNVTYNGATDAPTNTGSYTVVATVNDTNYQGSATNTLVIVPPAMTPILLGGSAVLADGTFQLSFTNTPGASFSVLGSADPTAPVADWTLLGSAVEVSPGQFQFIDLDATNEAQEFYMISSP